MTKNKSVEDRYQRALETVLAERDIDIGQLMSIIEEGGEDAKAILKQVRRPIPNADIVGITGPPGAGKSTLVDQLITKYLQHGKSVGVVAVDPESEVTGGAFLGDRIRMGANSKDERIFYRSLSSKSGLGDSLARSTLDIVSILDAMGKDIIIIETVGVGQTDTEIANIADSVLLTLAPGIGDQIQLNKAGVLEIGDIFVLNKADVDGVDNLLLNLKDRLSRRRQFSANGNEQWHSPIVKTVATEGLNVDSVISAIDSHLEYRKKNDPEYKRHILDELVKRNIEEQIRTEMDQQLKSDGLDAIVDEIMSGEADVYAAIDEHISL